MAIKSSVPIASSFSRFNLHAENSKKLSSVYRGILEEFNRQPFWVGGTIGLLESYGATVSGPETKIRPRSR